MSKFFGRSLVLLVMASTSLFARQQDANAQVGMASISIENEQGVYHAAAGISTGISCSGLLKNCPVPNWSCENASYQAQFDFGYNIIGANGGANKISVFATLGNNVNTGSVLTRDGVDVEFENNINSFLYGAGVSYSRFAGPIGVSVQYRAQRLITGPQLLANQQAEILDLGSNNYGVVQVGLKFRFGGDRKNSELGRAGNEIEEGMDLLDRLRKKIEDLRDDKDSK